MRRSPPGLARSRAALRDRNRLLIVALLMAAVLVFAAMRIVEAARNGWCWACG